MCILSWNCFGPFPTKSRQFAFGIKSNVDALFLDDQFSLISHGSDVDKHDNSACIRSLVSYALFSVWSCWQRASLCEGMWVSLSHCGARHKESYLDKKLGSNFYWGKGMVSPTSAFNFDLVWDTRVKCIYAGAHLIQVNGLCRHTVTKNF